MSQENVDMVRTLLSAFDRADYELALEALDSEIEWQVPPGIAIGREVYRGRDEVQRGFAEWLAAWDTHRFEPEEMLDHGDHVVVGGVQIGRGRGSGVEVRLPTFHVFTLRDEKVTRHRSYRDRSEALEAAGLRE
ncbi:MAG TPA: nuclear transport factor 2 family protein [Thermoleophilaceae bacterium]